MKPVCICSIIFLVSVSVCAQDTPLVMLETFINTHEVRLGDRFEYTITVHYPIDYNVQFPQLGAGVEYLDVIDEEDVTVVRDETTGMLTRSRKYILAAFRTDDFVIPPIGVFYFAPDGSTNILYTSIIPVHVVTELSNEALSNMELRDIKNVQTLPLDYTALYWILGSLAAAAVVTFLVLYFIKKSKRVDEIAQPIEPDYQAAFKALNALAEQGYVVNGEVKRYYTVLGDILREYCSRRYSIITMECTTEEIAEQLHRTLIEDDERQSVCSILSHCDLVKFAKLHPDERDYQRDWQRVYDFVDRTKLVVTETTDDDTDNPVEKDTALPEGGEPPNSVGSQAPTPNGEGEA